MRFLSNTFRLGVKELWSLARDPVMLVLITFTFTLSVYSSASSTPDTLSNAPIAIVDEDQSQLSQRIVAAFYPPQFKAPALIERTEVDEGLDKGIYTFVLHIPSNFQRDVLAGRTAQLQLNTDATRMNQAFLGSGYIQQMAMGEIREFVNRHGEQSVPAIDLEQRAQFNPALDKSWFDSLSQIVKAATTEFAKRGATITILGRNKAKTEQVIAELKAATGNQQLDYILCDLSRLSDVRRAAEEFKTRHDRLDVLVNNAGATFKKPSLGPDGIELTFALNHLAHFQLTTSLLDLIRLTPGARVVSTSSGTQALGRLDVDKTPTDLSVPGWRAYATSKLAAILFTKELQRRLAGSTATANCFEPGSVRTQFGGFGSDQGFLLNIVYFLAKPFSSTPEKGADSLVWLAASPEAAALQGEYVSKRRPATPSRQAQDPELARALWSRSEALCAQAAARAD